MGKIETALETIGHHLACARDGDSRREIEDAIDTLVRELGDLELMRRRMDQLHLTVAAQQVQIDGMQKILIGQGGQPQQPATPRREPIDVQALFDQYGDELNEFERVVNPLNPRPDIAAMILLDRLLPDSDPSRKMISSATREQVWLNVDLDDLAAVATEEDILTLVRCGVACFANRGLMMWV